MTTFDRFEIDIAENLYHALDDGGMATSAPIYFYEHENDCVESLWAVWFEDCLYIFSQEPFVDGNLTTDVFDASNSRIVYHKHFISDFKDVQEIAIVMYHIHMANMHNFGSIEGFEL